MDVHPTKNGMSRYWSIAICWKINKKLYVDLWCNPKEYLSLSNYSESCLILDQIQEGTLLSWNGYKWCKPMSIWNCPCRNLSGYMLGLWLGMFKMLESLGKKCLQQACRSAPVSVSAGVLSRVHGAFFQSAGNSDIWILVDTPNPLLGSSSCSGAKSHSWVFIVF